MQDPRSHPRSDVPSGCDGGPTLGEAGARGLAALIDVLPVAIFTTGPDLKIRRMNAAAATVLGVDPKAAVGRCCDELLECTTCAGDCSAITARERGETVCGYATELHPANVQPLAVRIDAVPLEGGEVAVILREAGPAAPLTTDERMREALRRAAGNVTRAAGLLGVHRTTLWRWMETHGVDRAEYFPR